MKDGVIYLGAKITSKGGSEPVIIQRIKIAKMTLGRLIKIWKTATSAFKTKRD